MNSEDKRTELERIQTIALTLDTIQNKLFDEVLELSPLERALIQRLIQEKTITLAEEAKAKDLLPKKQKGRPKGSISRDKADRYFQIVYSDIPFIKLSDSGTKPKWMHWTTYHRLRREYEYADELSEISFMGRYY